MKLGLGLGFSTSSKGAAGFVPSSTVALDAPVSSSMSSKAIAAFGFDRLVEGFSGNTVRLIRLSDNAEANFGFSSSTGMFDLAAVHTWRSGANVNVVKFYDQTGTAVEFVPDGTVTFIVSGTVMRFGTTWSSSTAELTRSASDGGVGCNFSGGTAALKTSTTLTANIPSDGLEIFVLHSWNNRKSATSAAGDAYGSTDITEHLLSYGVNSSNSYRWQTGTSFGGFGGFNAGGTADNASTNYPSKWKKYGQSVSSFRLTTTNASCYAFGRLGLNRALSGTSQTNITGGALNNGYLVVGGRINNSSGPVTVTPTTRADMIFGGVVVTKSLTSQERYLVNMKMSAVGQQHRLKSKADIEDYFDEIIYMKDINPSTGVVNGIKGKTSLTFTLPGTAVPSVGTCSYTFNYDHSCGLRGVYSDSGTNYANGFIASNNYMATKSRATIGSAHILDLADSNLYTAWCLNNGTQYDTGYGQKSMAIGYDHQQQSVWSMVAVSRDTDGKTGTRKLSNGSTIGDQTANQSMGKYNRNTEHVNFFYTGETIGGYATSESFWKNTDTGAPFTIDAPTGSACPENDKPLFKALAPVLHLATLEPPSGYNRANSYAANKPYLLDAVVKSYIGTVGSAIGHMVGDIATNNHAAVSESTNDAKIMSNHFLRGFHGVLFAFFFLPDAVLTQTQMEEIQVNSYKLLV